MMYKVLLSLLVVASAASATSEIELDKKLKAKEDSIASKRGLDIDGSISGVLVNSYMSSDQEVADKNILPNVERTQFVTADLGFHYRPFESVRANMILRLEAGMQNYFATSAKSLSVPWLNVEGNIGKDFYWVIGDFRQQYGPLTLFAPTGLDALLYEPMIFSRSRDIALKNAMIEGNQRNLQGVNLQFRHDFGGPLGEIRAEGIFSRLRRVQLLDESGANGNLLPNGYGNLIDGDKNYGSLYEGSYQSANMDKWMLSGNIELLPMNKNLLLGFTGMYIFDDSTSFTYTMRNEYQETVIDGKLYYVKDGMIIDEIKKPGNFDDGDYRVEYINNYDLNPQRTSIMAGRIGADVAGILGNKDLTLDLMGEVAFSNDQLYSYKTLTDESGNIVGVAAVTDEAGNAVVDGTGAPVFEKETVDDKGMAVNVAFNVGYRLPIGFGIAFNANYIMNDSNWFNPLAQSPQFFAARILNTDKDGNTSRFGVNSALYSTFGSLYYFDPKFTPAGTQMSTTDDPTIMGQTQSYNIAPYTKNAYRTSVYTRKELALMSSMLDKSVQMSLPNGFATPNRSGFNVDMKLGFLDFAEATALFSMLKQKKSDNVFMKEAEFQEFGAGLKVDVFKMLGFALPLELSGSYKRSVKTQELDNLYKPNFADKGELSMNFINAGLYVQYMPRLGISAGLQMINTEFDAVSSEPLFNAAPGYDTPLLRGKQMQWMVGLDYTVAENVYLALNYGWITTENTYNTASGVVGRNMPAYADINITDVEGNVVGTTSEYVHKFSQAVLQAVLNVNF